MTDGGLLLARETTLICTLLMGFLFIYIFSVSCKNPPHDLSAKESSAVQMLQPLAIFHVCHACFAAC